MKNYLFTQLCLCALLKSVYAADLPEELTRSQFSGPDLAPAPACISVKANGEVFVGVDMNGSLGKELNYGRIVKLIDTDNDGIADKHTVYCTVDDPRGLEAIGDQLYVLHSVVKEYTNDKGEKKSHVAEMHVTLFEDKDHDGVADDPKGKRLISDISSFNPLQSRGADHCTNGIRMGIDGWMYIAVGDFGFANATDVNGKKLTMYGGGIVRFRPDGSGLETYTDGMRNIYDMAIDPFMNMFTYGNTNDGGGWNVRFTHQIQSADYGYPRKFKNFIAEIIPALVDLGGGSGVGAMYLSEPGWPAHLNNIPLMGDWGLRKTFFHKVNPLGPTYTTEQVAAIGGNQVTDMDTDASGRLYLASWGGAGFKDNKDKGYIELIKPKDWTYKPFPAAISNLSDTELLELLKSPSSTARFHASREILARPDYSKFNAVAKLAEDQNLSLASRVAALYTFAQSNMGSVKNVLVHLAKEPELREHAIRAMVNDPAKQVATDQVILDGLKDKDVRVQLQSAIALGRLGKTEYAKDLLSVVPKGMGIVQKEFIPQKSRGRINKPLKFNVAITSTQKTILLETMEGQSAVWMNPSIILKDGSRLSIDKFQWKQIACGNNGTIAVNKKHDGTPLLNHQGKPTSGFGVHSPSSIEITLPENAKTFETVAVATTNAAPFALITNKTGNEQAAHSTPNPDIVIPHAAVAALAKLNASDACLAAVGTEQEDGALWALRYMHDLKVVDALIEKVKNADETLREKIYHTLARLLHKEIEYDGSHWWFTRPDTHGPYYKAQPWEATDKIANVFKEAYNDESQVALINKLSELNRMNIEGIGKKTVVVKKKEKNVADLTIEDLILELEKKKGNPENGKKVLLGGGNYKALSCVGCHKIQLTDKELGPDMHEIGSKLTREQLTVAIIQPAHSISDNWKDVVKKDGVALQGVVYGKDANTTIVRNIAGIETEVAKSDIKEIKPASYSIMGPHMVDHLTVNEFLDMIDYLHSLKGDKKEMTKKTITKVAAAVALSAATLGQAEEKTINALLVTGEGHHDYENQKRILSEGVSKRMKINWSIKHHKNPEAARADLSKAGWADGQDIVIYNICHASEADKAFVDGVCKVHHDGVPAMAIHCSMHSYNWRIEGEPKDKEWNKLIGVFSKNHGPKAAITVKKTDVDHPITKDMPAEWTTKEGELYNIMHVQDTTTILAHGDNGKANSPQPLVWVNRYGKAKVFGTTLGHHNSTMENPLYLDMITDAIRWATDK